MMRNKIYLTLAFVSACPEPLTSVEQAIFTALNGSEAEATKLHIKLEDLCQNESYG